MTQVSAGLTAIPDPIVLDVGLVVRSYHKSVIIKKKKNQKEEQN
jgi:hypothetical protein